MAPSTRHTTKQAADAAAATVTASSSSTKKPRKKPLKTYSRKHLKKTPAAAAAAAAAAAEEVSESDLTETEELTENAPPAVALLRRPQTTDSVKYWYISEGAWAKLVEESKGNDKKKVKIALNSLRKWDAAGRIMETDEGMDAPTPCYWCSRSGKQEPCKVWKDKEDLACAYCKRHAKSGCKAREKGKAAAVGGEDVEMGDAEDGDESSAMQERVVGLEEDSSAMHQRVLGLEDEIGVQAVKITALEDEIAGLKRVNEVARASWESMQQTVAQLWQQSGLPQ